MGKGGVGQIELKDGKSDAGGGNEDEVSTKIYGETES